ncbi:MAG: transglycosylase SLT domain-containing protein [Rubrivivax sp.]|nr:transglycosylase SLT domain-containing protein [Rubrivivax sp.]
MAATAWAHVAPGGAAPAAGRRARAARLAALWGVRGTTRRRRGATRHAGLAECAPRCASRRPNATGRWCSARSACEALPSGATGLGLLGRPRRFWRWRRAAAGDAARAEAAERLAGIAGRLSFYGKLATEALDQRFELPPPAAALQDAEREAATAHPGLTRALHLLALGLRSEGVREWNFSLRGLGERELLAAAQRACDHAVWDRCINTSDRTRTEVDLAQRFPTPFRDEVVAKAREIGLDPALMYGLIRQESRFVTDARSHVGASGLMQLMPGTARWTARKVGLRFTPGMINDPQVNLHLGASYLKLVLDDFDGSLAMATAAYNAGPNRPRRWREPSTIEAAAWAEGIPFNETRDYVKKVLSNQVLYRALLGGEVPALSALLGPPIGPRDPAARAPDRELP